MRISDWSSDLCSSDLLPLCAQRRGQGREQVGVEPGRARVFQRIADERRRGAAGDAGQDERRRAGRTRATDRAGARREDDMTLTAATLLGLAWKSAELAGLALLLPRLLRRRSAAERSLIEIGKASRR